MRSVNRLKSGATSKTTEEGHARAQIEELRAVVEEIRGLGLNFPEIEEKLLESSEAIEGLSDVNLVPSFDDAARIAMEGLRIGQAIVSSHKAASSAIEKAEELVQDEYENQGSIHGNVFQHLILSPSLDKLKESRQCLRNGDFERVYAMLDDLRTLPGIVRRECQDNAEIYRYCETLLEDMREEGVATQEIEDILRIARTAFLNGRFARVRELSEVIEEKAIKLREKHRLAVRALKRAKKAGIAAEKINARSSEAEESIVEACLSMKEGDYDKCIQFSERAASDATQTCKRYRNLALRIKALRKDIKRLGQSQPRDVEDMLKRAERELKKGNHQSSQAEVEIASLLLNQYDPYV